MKNLTIEQGVKALKILASLPDRQDHGGFAPGDDVKVAELLAALLDVFGIGFFHSIGLNLSKLGLPPDVNKIITAREVKTDFTLNGAL